MAVRRGAAIESGGPDREALGGGVVQINDHGSEELCDLGEKGMADQGGHPAQACQTQGGAPL
eukprot:8258215-Pyramimonas_sp.AAC.1